MFLAVVNFVKGNKIAQYALLALLALGIYGVWALHERSLGETKGAEKQKQGDVKQVGDDVVQERARLKTDLDASHEREAKLTAAATISADNAAKATALAAKLHQQGLDLRQQLAQMADSDLHPYVVSRLGLRQQNDKTACYTPREERALADAVDQGPVCQQEKDRLQTSNTEQAKQVQALIDQVNEVLARDQRRAQYTERLEGALVKLYGLHPPKVRSMVCLRMWHCGKGELKLPDLAELKGATHD